MDFFLIAHQIGHILVSSGLIQLALMILGYVIGKASPWSVPIRIAGVMYAAFSFWMQHHPHGKEIADLTSADEKLQGIYDKHLCKDQDVVAMCGGAGKVPNLNDSEVG